MNLERFRKPTRPDPPVCAKLHINAFVRMVHVISLFEVSNYSVPLCAFHSEFKILKVKIQIGIQLAYSFPSPFSPFSAFVHRISLGEKRTVQLFSNGTIKFRFRFPYTFGCPKLLLLRQERRERGAELSSQLLQQQRRSSPTICKKLYFARCLRTQRLPSFFAARPSTAEFWAKRPDDLAAPSPNGAFAS